MADTREVELLTAESIAVAGVRTVNVDLTEPITRMDFIWRKTNTNRTPIAHPACIVPSIQIVDGADVLASLSGGQTQAYAYYKTGLIPGSKPSYEVGSWSIQCASIYFGRHMWDPVLALDPKRFSNVQIKITHNLALGGATGTVADLSIYAHVFDEKVVQPIGFHMYKDIYSFLPVANAWVYIDLPSDHKIRSIMFGAEQCTDSPEWNLNAIKIDEAEGRRILVQSLMERYLYQNAARDPVYMEHIEYRPAATTAFAFYAAPHWERSFVGLSAGAADGVGYVQENGCVYHTTKETAVSVVEGWAQGHCPFGQVYIPFGEQSDADGGWDIAKAGSGRVSLQAAAAPVVAQAVRVYVEQIRKY